MRASMRAQSAGRSTLMAAGNSARSSSLDVPPLVGDELAHHVVDRLARQLAAGAHALDRVRQPAQPLAFLAMIGLDVADGARGGRIPHLEDVDDHVLLGMVAVRRVFREIVDDGLQGLVVGALAPVEHAELLLEHPEQLLDVAMLFAQDVDESRHGPMPDSGPSPR